MNIKQLLIPFGALCAGAVILSACGDKEVRATPSNDNWRAPEIWGLPAYLWVIPLPKNSPDLSCKAFGQRRAALSRQNEE